DPLLEARRVGLDLEVALVLQPDVVERRVRPLQRRRARQPRQLAGVDAELDRRHRREVALRLGHVADVIADGERVPARRAAEDQGLALEGREAEEELAQRRLAGAVRAEEADALAVDGAAEAPQRLDRAVALPHVAQLDHLAQRNLRLGELSTGISGFLSMARSAPGGDDRPGMRVLL